jgi:osmotically-inducible protein OsmY
MKKFVGMLAMSAAFAAGDVGLALSADPATTGEAAKHAPDNSGRNVRDRNDETLTATDQSNRKSDVEVTQKIRKQVVDDDSLSTLAHNVKIITVDGIVTLRGPVKSEAEKERIASVAKKIAGPGKVKDNLEIAQ